MERSDSSLWVSNSRMRWKKVGHVYLTTSGSQLGSQAMRTSRASLIVIIVYNGSLLISVASELLHAQPVFQRSRFGGIGPGEEMFGLG
eukprot:1138876-Pelagomonas_calceolata.AAC.1